jgi:hypothetical protein
MKLFLLILIFAYFTGMYWLISIIYIGNTLFPTFEGEVLNFIHNDVHEIDLLVTEAYDDHAVE